MDLGHLADFFKLLLASGPQPPGCRPETSTNSKKSAKWPRSISQSEMIQKFIFRGVTQGDGGSNPAKVNLSLRYMNAFLCIVQKYLQDYMVVATQK